VPRGIIATTRQIRSSGVGSTPGGVASSPDGVASTPDGPGPGGCNWARVPPDSGFDPTGLLRVWLLVFFLTPIVEMYLLIKVGGYIGAWPTIALVMVTAVIGVTVLRIQGLATLTRGVGRLNRGELPAREMVEGLLLAVAGALLLTPGFVTDAFGFLLLVPPARRRIAEHVLRRVRIVGLDAGTSHAADRGEPTVIEGEFEPVEPEASPSSRDSSESGNPPDRTP